MWPRQCIPHELALSLQIRKMKSEDTPKNAKFTQKQPSQAAHCLLFPPCTFLVMKTAPLAWAIGRHLGIAI